MQGHTPDRLVRVYRKFTSRSQCNHNQSTCSWFQRNCISIWIECYWCNYSTSFTGSLSGLTDVPCNLTGILPAIDGSNLLNVNAVGSGIVVEDNDVNIGSARTVNFGDGLDVTYNVGIASISASGGSLQSRTTVTGVTTASQDMVLETLI